MGISPFLWLALIEILRLYSSVTSEPFIIPKFHIFKRNLHDLLKSRDFGYEIYYTPNDNENYVRFVQSSPQDTVNGNYYEPRIVSDDTEHDKPPYESIPSPVSDFKTVISDNSLQTIRQNHTRYIEDIIRPAYRHESLMDDAHGEFEDYISLYETLYGELHYEYSENAVLNPKKWFLKYPMCDSVEQSPVNINVRMIRQFPGVISQPLSFVNYDLMPDDVTLKNTGHSAQVSFKYPRFNKPFIEGGPFKHRYVFDELHFHWGKTNSRGSEHTVNSKHFAGEIHAVHIRSDYETFEEALKDPHGLLVVAFFLELHESAVFEPEMNMITNSLVNVIEANSKKELYPFPPSTIIDTTFSDGYVVYAGSLTTPPCTQIVTWVIAPETLAISRAQLSKFRRLKTDIGTKMSQNNRMTQPMERRKIFRI